MSSDSNIQLQKTLVELGLSHNEACVYLTLLSIGPNAASTIAKKADLNRAGCYSVLKRLIKKGFIQETIRENISFFIAVNPKCIIGQLESKKDDLDAKIRTMVKTVEHMALLRCEYPMRPKVVLFEGENGLQNILEDTLNTQDIIRTFAAVNELASLLPDYFPQYCRRRIEKGIQVRTIYPENIKADHPKKVNDKEMSETILKDSESGFRLDIMVYGNKVAMTSLSEKFGVLIESRDMADGYKRIFDIMWSNTSQKKSVPGNEDAFL